jgi:branched-chain amino acid aminotransferase
VTSHIVMIDGAIVPPELAHVSVYDRGFLFGDGVFEVLRTYRGAPFAIDEHIARLRRSAEKVLIALPVDEPALRNEITSAVRASDNEESYVRVVLTRGTGPLSLDPDTAIRPLRVVLVAPLVSPPAHAYAAGIRAVLVHTRRTTDETAAAGAKVSNYLASLLAVREAKMRGGDEALIVDAHGNVVEGATSNVFVVREGLVATPPEEAGILAGITRAYIVQAAKDLGIPCEERALPVAEIFDADEVFVTSTIRELLSVAHVDDRSIGIGSPGPIARALYRQFRRAVEPSR